ncbi:hypothetical protein ACWEPL_38855 [Nonomuraea sp. NPDC004186]
MLVVDEAGLANKDRASARVARQFVGSLSGFPVPRGRDGGLGHRRGARCSWQFGREQTMVEPVNGSRLAITEYLVPVTENDLYF